MAFQNGFNLPIFTNSFNERVLITFFSHKLCIKFVIRDQVHGNLASMKCLCFHEQRSMLLYFGMFFFTEEAIYVWTFIFLMVSKQRSYSFVFNVYSSVLLFQCYTFSTVNVLSQDYWFFQCKTIFESPKKLLENLRSYKYLQC